MWSFGLQNTLHPKVMPNEKEGGTTLMLSLLFTILFIASVIDWNKKRRIKNKQRPIAIGYFTHRC
jgi:hypothetical protein